MPRWKDAYVPYAFLAPASLAMLAVFFYPLVDAFWLSLHEGSLAQRSGEFVGVRQYARVLGDHDFSRSLITSAAYSLINVAGVVSVGLACALLIHGTFPGRFIAGMLLMSPWPFPYVAAAMIWGWMYSYDYGVLNYILQSLPLIGGKIEFLTSSPEAFYSVSALSIWKLFPVAMVMYLAGLQTIPQDLFEAATVDGAGAIARFRHITLPALRPITTTLVLLVAIWTFGSAFTAIFVLTEGGPGGVTETLVLRTYLEAFKYFRPGTAAAMGMIVLAISLVFSILLLRFSGGAGRLK